VTAVRFDPDAGRLRLDQAAFDQLVAIARDGEGAAVDPALRDAGVVRDGGLHPLVADAMRSVAAPVCRLRLDLAGEDGPPKAGDGWLAGDGAALLLDLPEAGLRDLVSVPTDLVPAAIARLVRLGPRPRPEAEAPVFGPDLVAGLLAADPTDRRRAADALSLSGWRSWLAQMAWSDPRSGLTGRAVQVIDAEAGLFLVDDDGERTTLWPTTPSAVWRLLVLLLPKSDELA
jgi:hypothetical protein